MEWWRRLNQGQCDRALMKENQVVKDNKGDAMDRGKKSNLSR